MDEDFGFNGLI
jgi:hypothetical protein